ncbi:uncharacterized protein LOC116162406 [Photinus pyralis]|nr:uncharacterized protein LOC116162406 [Photinus pyralis]
MVKKEVEPQPIVQLQAKLQQESELGRVERQQRNLATECAALSGGKRLAKQRKVVDILNHENYNILNDLYVATGGPKKLIDSRHNKQLTGLLKENDVFERQIKQMRLSEIEIDEQIQLTKKKVIEAQSKVTTDAEHMKRVLEGQKTLATLENKLDTFVKQTCAINDENHRLRDEIDHYLFERNTFNKAWYGNIATLAKGKKIMMDLIEQATISYDRRDETVAVLHALREKCHMDLVVQTEEMASLQRIKDHESKLAKFMDVKGQKRCMRDLLDRKETRRDERHNALQNQLVRNEEILNRVWKMSGTARINDFVAAYTQREFENYTTFNLIAALHFECETLNDSIIRLKDDITTQANINSARAQMQLSNLKKYKETLQNLNKEFNNELNSNKRIEKILERLFDGILKLFTLCKCDLTPFATLLGENAGVNRYNVSLFLQILDGQVNDLLLKSFFKQKTQPKVKGKAPVTTVREDVRPHRVNPIQKVVPTNPCPLCVEKEQVSDVIDLLQFVHSRGEAEVKLANRLKLPDGLDRLHNVSACNLPQSRAIIQRRYQ